MPPEVKPPVEFRISAKVSAAVGFKSGRVRITVQTGVPLVGAVNLWLEAADIPAVERIVAAQREWMAKSPMERLLTGGDE